MIWAVLLIAGTSKLTPVGKVSPSAAPVVSAAAFGLPSTIRSTAAPLGAICTGRNSLPSVGGSRVVNEAVAGAALVTPSAEVSAPSATTLLQTPGTLASTSTAKLQEPPAGTVALVRRAAVPEGTAVTTPPLQLVVALGVVALKTLAG